MHPIVLQKDMEDSDHPSSKTKQRLLRHFLKRCDRMRTRGLSYTGSTHALGACRLGSIPSSPTN